MLELKNIELIFNAGTNLEKQIFKNFNLKLNQSEFTTIIGGNGAGKSTLMNIIAGEIKPNKGSIWLNNINITNFSIEERSGLIARVYQDPMAGTCADLTIEENLAIADLRGKKRSFNFSLNKKKSEKYKSILSELNIGLENRLHDKVGLLSGGQRQILSLVMASLQPAKLLLLDEHTAALDPKMAKIVLELTDKIVKENKLTSLMITHSMNQALQHGSRTIMMYHGEIVKDLEGEDRVNLEPTDLLEFFIS